MATSDDDVEAGGAAAALFNGVEWNSSPITFHRNTGKNIKLTERKTVATRTEGFNKALVFSSEPMVVGQMLKVTVTETQWDEFWFGGMVRAH